MTSKDCANIERHFGPLAGALQTQPTGERAPSKTACRSRSLDVATCSLPVSSAEVFYRELLEKIADWPRNDRGRRMAQSGLIFWDQMQREKNRRQMEAPIQRQPEENVKDDPRRSP